MHKEYFYLCRIVINLFLDEIVDVFTIHQEYKSILGLFLVVYLDFREGRKVAEGNCQRVQLVLGTVSLFGSYNILTYCQFREFCVSVKHCRYSAVEGAAF